MSPRSSVTPPSPPLASEEMIAMVGHAWRELRRGASMQALRERIYQGDQGMVDLGLADALEVIDVLDGCRMRELAEALRVDPSTATRTVDRLVGRGLVERVADPDDARGVLVVTTASGHALRERVRAQAQTAMGEILREFTPEEGTQLAALMEKLVAAVDRYIGSVTHQNSSDR
jgi:DNA-binding MarR family transcriptional regulator